MKKFFVGLMAIMVSMTLFAERVSPDVAAQVANNFMNVNAANSAIKKAVPAKKMVRKATATEDLYYLYENENGEGWVIVAANDAMTPILAYSETGQFRTDNMPNNIRKWLGKYNNFTRRIEADGLVASEEAQTAWRALRKGTQAQTATVIVAPLVQTTWDQDSPYWNKCPGTGSNKAYTGCVATAMAQVMNYWEWPEQGTGTHSYKPLNPNTGRASTRYTSRLTVNFEETTYDWDNMLDSYSGSYTNAQADAVATLMYHCGVATEMMYGNDADGGSGTYTVNYGDWTWGISTTDEGGCAQNALYTFFKYKQPTGYMRDGYYSQGVKYYDSWTDAAWTQMLKDELDLQHPIMYAGASDQGGHSFICDGYDSNNKFHFNWGWSGSNDGYYTLSNLAPGSGGAGGGSYDFSEDQDVIIGIVPDRGDTPVETVQITWSVNGVAGEPVEETVGELITLPANPVCEDCDKVFVGWTAQSIISANVAPADMFTTNAGKTAATDKTYYAVFADVEEGGSTETAFDGQTSGSYKIYAIVNGVKHYATLVNNSKLQSSTDVNEATVFTITKVADGITIHNGSNYIKHSSGTNIAASPNAYTWGLEAGTKGTWRVNSEVTGRALVFREGDTKVFGGYATSNIRDNGEYYDLEIGDPTGGAAFSNYSLTCDCTPSEEAVISVEAAPKAVKIIDNGQIVILLNNKKYTIFGQQIQ